MRNRIHATGVQRICSSFLCHFSFCLLVAVSCGVGHATVSAEDNSPATAAGQVELRGRVVGPNGRPVEGARLYLSCPTWVLEENFGLFPSPPALEVRATTGADGTFQFTVGRPEIDLERHGIKQFAFLPVVAMGPATEDGQTSPSYGIAFECAWVFDPSDRLGRDLPPHASDLAKRYPLSDLAARLNDEKREPILRLVEDDSPLTGCIKDETGQSVAGARVSVRELWTLDNDDVTGFLNAIQDEDADFDRARREYQDRRLGAWLQKQDLESILGATTDRDGSFRLTGIGRNRIAGLIIEGPGIQPRLVYAYTKPGPIVRPEHEYRGGGRERITFSGASFEHVAPVSVPIVGTVRDIDTGMPLAGVRIRSHRFANTRKIVGKHDLASAVTDGQGRYRLNGMPIGKENKLIVIPVSNQPYLPSVSLVDVSADKEEVPLDITLKRGAWIRGRITDVKTGQPVVSHVHYFVFCANPHADSAPGLHGASLSGVWSFYLSDRDGRYAVPGLPGRGLVTVFARNHERYPRGVGAERIRQGRRYDARIAGAVIFDTEPAACHAENYHAVTEVRPPEDGKDPMQDFQLDPGETLDGIVLDPEGRPLAGARYRSLLGSFSGLKSERFAVHQYFPGKPRRLEFWHEERELAGWRIVEGPQTEPVTVRLEPCGFLTGRIVDGQGKPIVKALILGWYMSEDDLATGGEPPKDYYFTDQQGRFRIVGLAPGLKYNIGVKEQTDGAMCPMVFDAIVKPGETKDIGDFSPTALKEALDALEQSMTQEELEKLSESEIMELMKGAGVIDGSH